MLSALFSRIGSYLPSIAGKAPAAPRTRTIKHIVVHCTAGPRNQSAEEIKAYWARVHKDWKGRPGYHILVLGDGSAVRLQPDSDYTNGVAGFNAGALHVCYTGGQNGVDTRTDAQKETLRKRLAYWKSIHPQARIVGHRDLSPDRDGDGVIEPHEWVKQCPAFNAINEYRDL